MATGVAGNKIVQSYRSWDSQQANYTTAILDRWTGEGTSDKYDIARLGIILKHAVASLQPLVDLLLILEYAGCLEAPEVTDGLAVFGAVEFGGVVVPTECTTATITPYGPTTGAHIPASSEISA